MDKNDITINNKNKKSINTNNASYRKPNKKKQPKNRIRNNKNAKLQSINSILSRELIPSGYKELLLYPEHMHNGRIPSEFGKATCTLHRHITTSITTNNTGYAFIAYNPQFLQEDGLTQTSLLINTDVAYNASTNFGSGAMPTLVNYQLPAGNASSYRIVSCSMHVVPQSSLLSASGKITMAVLTPQSTVAEFLVGTPVHNIDDIAVLTNLNNVKRSAVTDVCQQQVARGVYLPFDYDSFEFSKINSAMTNNDHPINWFSAIITGAVTQNFTIEIYMNYELIPRPGSILIGTEEVNKSSELPSKIITDIDTSSNQVIGSYRGHADYKPSAEYMKSTILSSALTKLGVMQQYDLATK
jgi:hypothetical protein